MPMIFYAFIVCFLITSPAKAERLELDTEKSQVKWKGTKKVTEDSHEGIIKIKKGHVNLDNKGQVQGGTLILDMNTIEVQDLSGNYKKKLQDHLNSDDFFDVKNNPEASFKITEVKAKGSSTYEVTGNLTLRGVTQVESFVIEVDKDKKSYSAKGSIEVDRTKYGVTYNQESSLLKKTVSIPKDKIIKDKVEISLDLKTLSL